MDVRRLALLCALACAPLPVSRPPSPPREVSFDRYDELSSNAELARRALTPLTLLRGEKIAMRPQAIDLAQERFTLFVPRSPPPYGLFVYISPWDKPAQPLTWERTLERHGMIFVNASNSGNSVRALDRRVPLAVLAAINVLARYPIDRERVYVGGFSGGSETAQIAAVAYPDLFRGALLYAGAMPLDGSEHLHLPPRPLFEQLQRTRFVFATGERDEPNLRDDLRARASLYDHCIFDLEIRTARREGHEPLDADSFERALDALEKRNPPDAARLAECNARLSAQIDAQLDAARSLRDLDAIDARWSGLAAPRILDLAPTLR